jgi:signal transduction histidine kinase
VTYSVHRHSPDANGILRAACRQIIDGLAALARDRQITFDGDVEGAGAWDEHRIVQAISKLTSNAVDHGAPASASMSTRPTTPPRSVSCCRATRPPTAS